MKHHSLARILAGSLFALLVVRGTAPPNDNSGSCTAPILAPRIGTTVMHFAWSGPVAGEDSVSTSAGTLITFTRNVPAGTYLIRAWASDGGGAGCDTSIVRHFGGPPWKTKLEP